MKKITLLLFYVPILFFHSALAQEAKIERAEKQYDRYAFIRAIDIYERVAEKGYKSAEVFKKLGNSYYYNANYEKSAKWYKELMALNDPGTEAEYYFRYAQSLKALKLYEEADQMMEKFNALTATDTRAQLFEEQPQYLEVIKFQSGRYRIESFPQNSPYADFAPSFYQKSLVFSSARDTGRFTRYKHAWNDEPFLDLYGGPLSGNDAVQGIQKFSKNLNTRFHESTTAFTKDGNTVYFTRSNYTNKKYGKDEKGINRLKIYKATLKEGEWTDIEELPFNSNDYSVAHPALDAQETRLYFVSDMPGSEGLSDIYSVEIKSDGSYGEPVNLGKSVNTGGRETFPYVSTNGNLYFASDGHPGLGGLDVFVTTVDANGNAAEVHNVGRPINSPEDDFSFIIDDTTKRGFFASNRDGGMGSDDIYILEETEALQLTCKQQVTGVITDKDSGQPIENAEVLSIDTDNNVVERSYTDASGTYALSIDCTKDGFVRASKEGYLTNESLVKASYSREPIKVDLELEKDAVTAGLGDDLAKILQLKPIYFNFDKWKIRKDSEIELAKVLAAMEKYPTLKIDIRSHTDSRGGDSYNLRLSEKRAKATIDYLVKNGIDPSRLSGKGYGETQLVNECSNGVKCPVEKHEKNRRSEFVIMQ
ncbi:OmpA family protein [Ascidiimonas aurantiaca]|uniref:OmpA family protein n=1 Tax=Ascidiimonas aurantiaca TaxID=1685432 RepID=UPI0030ECBDBA